MNGREAVKALLDGRKVRREIWCRESYRQWSDGAVVNSEQSGFLYSESLGDIAASTSDDWELYEEPLTDEQLIAEWEEASRRRRLGGDEHMATAFSVCARQLRERKL